MLALTFTATGEAWELETMDETNKSFTKNSSTSMLTASLQVLYLPVDLECEFVSTIHIQ
jgi:hypothetical protein